MCLLTASLPARTFAAGSWPCVPVQDKQATAAPNSPANMDTTRID